MGTALPLPRSHRSFRGKESAPLHHSRLTAVSLNVVAWAMGPQGRFLSEASLTISGPSGTQRKALTPQPTWAQSASQSAIREARRPSVREDAPLRQRADQCLAVPGLHTVQNGRRGVARLHWWDRSSRTRQLMWLRQTHDPACPPARRDVNDERSFTPPSTTDLRVSARCARRPLAPPRGSFASRPMPGRGAAGTKGRCPRSSERPASWDAVCAAQTGQFCRCRRRSTTLGHSTVRLQGYPSATFRSSCRPHRLLLTRSMWMCLAITRR
jgi:hypothetical protein